MAILLPIFILIGAPCILLIIHRWWPKPGLYWLTVTGLSAITWLIILLARKNLPAVLLVFPSLPDGLSLFTIRLILDPISWSISLACSAAILSSQLTTIISASAEESLPRKWASWLTGSFFIGLGLIGVLAGNLNTIILAWAAFDLCLFLLQFAVSTEKEGFRNASVAFSIQIVSLMLLITAGIQESFIDFGLLGSSNPFITNPLILSGASLRIFSLAWILRSGNEDSEPHHTRTLVALASVSSSIALISRTTTLADNLGAAPFTLIAMGLIALILGLLWFVTRDPNQSKVYWITGVAAFAITGALLGETEASLAWGIGLILSGGVLFNYIIHKRAIFPFIILGLIGFSTLPFTPAWQGVKLYSELGTRGSFVVGLGAMLIGQALYLAGYPKLAILSQKSSSVTENWSLMIYPLGLLVLPATQIIIFIWGIPGLGNNLQAFPSIRESWPAFVAVGLAVLFGFLGARIKRLDHFAAIILQIFSRNWIPSVLSSIFAGLIGFARFMDRLFEGNGGFLWTLLFLVLLIGFIIQVMPGR